jgi:hypothetical protein
VLVSEGTGDRDGSCDPYVLLCYHRPGADDVYEDLDAALADGTGFAKTGTIADSHAPVWPDEQVCSPFAARALAVKRNYMRRVSLIRRRTILASRCLGSASTSRWARP